MKHAEKHELVEILEGPPFHVRMKLEAFLKTVEVENAPTRTEQQNKALHVWFQQVSDECIKNHVDAKMVMAKVMRMNMTPAFIKEMWRALQQALFQKKSTTQLRKTGEIDTLYDHFARFFAEEFKMELPPFPSDEEKQKEVNSGYKTGGTPAVPYPRDYKEPTF